MASNSSSSSLSRFLDISSAPQRMLAPIAGYEKMPLVSLEEAVQPLLQEVPEVNQMVWRVKQDCESPAGWVTPDQSASIMLYTMGWFPSEDSLCFILNERLRSAERCALKQWFLFLKLLLSALSRLPSTTDTVYRGIRLDLHHHYPTNSTLVWWGFSSCTTTLAALQSMNYAGTYGGRTIFNIDCYSSKDIRQHSFFSTENEALLPAARQFRVISSLDAGNELHIIQLKEIESLFPLLAPVSLLKTVLLNRPFSGWYHVPLDRRQ